MTEMHIKTKSAKLYGILAIAVSAARMTRVFERGATRRIREELARRFDSFLSVRGPEEFHRNHHSFCEWFQREIKTRTGEPASWGQAAKLLDIVLKVCIYYCKLPSISDSERIAPWLNAAVDTPRLKALKGKHKKLGIADVNTVQAIDRDVYQKLQDTMREEMNHFSGKILLVQYDDIMWVKENIEENSKREDEKRTLEILRSKILELFPNVGG